MLVVVFFAERSLLKQFFMLVWKFLGYPTSDQVFKAVSTLSNVKSLLVFKREKSFD